MPNLSPRISAFSSWDSCNLIQVSLFTRRMRQLIHYVKIKIKNYAVWCNYPQVPWCVICVDLAMMQSRQQGKTSRKLWVTSPPPACITIFVSRRLGLVMASMLLCNWCLFIFELNCCWLWCGDEYIGSVRGNYRTQALLSIIQHKSLEVVCNMDVIFDSWFDVVFV
jgi:hypothetical protein